MQSYSIGLSGLGAAQKALDVIGNNIANAATEGYHRQKIELTPAYTTQVGDMLFGGGVSIEGVTRVIDTLLEQQILLQQSSLGQIESELQTLQAIENAFGELSDQSGLSAAIDNFFNALHDLAAHPDELVWQSQAVTAASAMAEQFRTLADFLDKLQTHIILEANSTVERINSLAAQIGTLNQNILRKEVTGGQANDLRDQRDQAIKELSELIALETYQRDFGVVDVVFNGIPAVTGTTVNELEAGFTDDGKLGISIAGLENYYTDTAGGRIAALLSLKNEILASIRSDLDDLANTIITQINNYHVQAVGSEGSFTQLTGWSMPSENLSEFDGPISSGKIYLRLTDTSSGTVSRYEIDVDPSTDTLSSIAAKITADIPGLSASVNNSKLTITADAPYRFDFLPAVLSSPTTETLNGSSPPAITVSGIYSGTSNDTFTFTVSQAGTVGNGNLQLVVTNSGGETVATLNIGQGYAAGEMLEVGNGIKITVGAGDFAAGDNFQIEAFASTDTAGLLASIGINTLFSGSGAGDIAVCQRILDSPASIGTALGADMTDNTNAVNMAALRDRSFSSLDGLTPTQFYHRMVTDLGQDISIRQMQQENAETIARNLAEQQSQFSGVDINEEAAQMLIFEQLFNAMAKYIATVNSSLSNLMELL